MDGLSFNPEASSETHRITFPKNSGVNTLLDLEHQVLEADSLLSKDVTLKGKIVASHKAAPGSILGIPKNFSLDVAEIYCRRCLEQWTEA